MKLESVEALAIRADSLESAFVKIVTDAGLGGWGEVQAPRVAGAACEIVHSLLKPALEGVEFRGSLQEIELLREKMLSIGGCMAEAISGVELALWDLAAKTKSLSISRLIAGQRARGEVPAYVSGLSALDLRATVQSCRDLHRAGFRYFEIDYDCDPEGLLKTLDALREELGGLAGVAVNAQHRLDPQTAAGIMQRKILWIKDPPAQKAAGTMHPHLGLCGLTEAYRIARMAADNNARVAVSVGVSLGPQLAAAIQFAATLPAGSLVECDPEVMASAYRVTGALPVRNGKYPVPQLPGLGIEIDEPELRLMEERSR